MHKRRSVLCTALIVVLCVVAMVTLPSVRCADTDSRRTMCGGMPDCVVVVASKQAALAVDGVDLSTDTIADVVAKLPSWFGSQHRRPLSLEHTDGTFLTEGVALSEQGVEAGDSLAIISTYRSDIKDDL